MNKFLSGLTDYLDMYMSTVTFFHEGALTFTVACTLNLSFFVF